MRRALYFSTLGLMAVLYVAAGVNHFLNPAFYVNLMPPWLPAHLFLVHLSGVAEIALGLGLFIPVLRAAAAWGIIAMLAAFMPVHLHMLANAADYPEAPYWGLVLRIPLQGLLAAWAWAYTRPAPQR
jgi:uncharacterized membrane protein